MARLVIIGAGLGGLASALFLSRRGHEVELLEKDAGDPPNDKECRAPSWRRRGVPQMCQPHNFLGLSRAILKAEAPDLLDRLMASGCGLAMMDGFPSHDPDRLFHSTVAARETYERTLRELIMQEPRVRLRTGARVIGLQYIAGPMPHVHGVTIEGGETVDADLTIDFSGRFTKAGAWLKLIGVRDWTEQAQRTPFTYMTRWYALKAGRDFPSDKIAVRQELGFGSAFAFPADKGRFSLTLLLSNSDPLRGAAMRPEAFDRVIAALPSLRDWLDAGVALTEPEAMGGIDNRLRRLSDRQGPTISGFILAGDAAMLTNATLGRGASLALLAARWIANAAERSATDAQGLVRDYDRWIKKTLAPWYMSQVEADAGRIEEMAAAIEGRTNANETPSFFEALLSLAEQDVELGLLLNRNIHLLDSPDILAAPQIVSRVEMHRLGLPTTSFRPSTEPAFCALLS